MTNSEIAGMLVRHGWPEAGTKWQANLDTLERIASLCRQHADPRSNPGAHRLALDVLKLMGEQ